MIYENSDSEKLKRDGQFKYREIYKVHDGLLYHYTKLDTLWKILDSDSLYARNIRFSNDTNEFLLGQDIIEKFIKQCLDLTDCSRIEIIEDIKRNPIMNFMVCFCKNGDLLSQWRGYARGGVSLGFDFNEGEFNQESAQKHIEYFCVLNNQKYQDLCEEKKTKKYFIDNKPLLFVQMPYQVQYVSEEKDLLQDKIKDILRILWESNPSSDLKLRARMLFEYIPFIKNYTFKEEEEYRLIFDMDYLKKTKGYTNYIRSKKIEYINDNGIKKPYINIEFGKPDDKNSDVNQIWIGDDVKELFDIIHSIFIQFNTISVERKFNCYGIFIGDGKNQEDIVLKIEEVLEENGILLDERRVKIWCKGHLPIREIIIGSSEYQYDIKECLEYYKKTVYWLRYIDIRLSSIPFRN